MFRFPLLSLDIVRPKLGLKSNTFNALTNCKGRSWLTLQAFPPPIARLAGMSKPNTSSAQARELHTDIENAKSNEPKDPPKNDRITYRNKHGEEILFANGRLHNPPFSYEFVPAGNSALTRQCRLLANGDIYALHSSRTKLRPSKHLGIYVRSAVVGTASVNVKILKQNKEEEEEMRWKKVLAEKEGMEREANEEGGDRGLGS